MYNFFKIDKHEKNYLKDNEQLPPPAVKLFAGYDSRGKLRYDCSTQENYCEHCNKLFQICLYEGKGVCYRCYEKLTLTTTAVPNLPTKKHQRKSLLKPRPELLSELGSI